jgi:hypothetical protein
VDGLLAFDAPSKRGLRFLWQDTQLNGTGQRLQPGIDYLFIHANGDMLFFALRSRSEILISLRYISIGLRYPLHCWGLGL